VHGRALFPKLFCVKLKTWRDHNRYASKGIIMSHVTTSISLLTAALFNFAAILAPAKAQDATEPLHQAAEVGDVNQVQQLLSKGTDVNAIDRAGFTPLFYAAYKGHKEAAEILIAGGANVNAKDRYDNTPLHYAAMAGYHDVCKLLVAKGANVNARNMTGGTPLAMAKAGGHNQIVELLSINAVTARAPERTVSRPGLTATPDAQPATEPDPIADPNAVRASLRQFKGLEEALDQVDRRSRQYEAREWLDRSADNRAKMAEAVHRQARAEFAVMRNIAVEENAKKTTAVIDSILQGRQQRYTKLIKQIEEQLRDRAPSRGMPGSSRRERYRQDRQTAERTPRERTTGSIDDPNVFKTSIKPVAGLEKELEALAKRSENEMQQWLASSSDSKISLANTVQEQIKAEFILTRKVAVQEAAKKITAAIDGLLLARQMRLARLVEKMQEQTQDPRQIRDPHGQYR
jgi:hypothetical protein